MVTVKYLINDECIQNKPSNNIEEFIENRNNNRQRHPNNKEFINKVNGKFIQWLCYIILYAIPIYKFIINLFKKFVDPPNLLNYKRHKNHNNDYRNFVIRVDRSTEIML